MKSIALMIRTHVMNEQVCNLYAQMERLAPDNVDVYLCCDQTNGKLDIPETMRAVPHSTADVERLGLLPFFKKKMLWYSGDYAMYFFHDEHPEYDLYFMVEYDVFFTDRSLLGLFAQINANTVDYFGVRVWPAREDWKWTEAAYYYQGTAYQSFFPMVGLSKAAMEQLLADRRAHTRQFLSERTRLWVHCEAFVPTAIHLAGLSVDHLDHRVGVSPKQFGPPDKTLACADLLDVNAESNLIWHPVFPARDYLQKLVNFAGERPLDSFLNDHPAHLSTLAKLDPYLLVDVIGRQAGAQTLSRVQAQIRAA